MRLGLVNKIADDESAVDAAVTIAEAMAQHARYALVAAKCAMTQSLGESPHIALRTEALLFDQTATPDQQRKAQEEAARRDPAYAKFFTSQDHMQGQSSPDSGGL